MPDPSSGPSSPRRPNRIPSPPSTSAADPSNNPAHAAATSSPSTVLGTAPSNAIAPVPIPPTASAPPNLRHRHPHTQLTSETPAPPNPASAAAPTPAIETAPSPTPAPPVPPTTTATSTTATPAASAVTTGRTPPTNPPTLRERAVAGVMGLGIMTAAVGGTYLLSDNEAVFPIAVVACVATVSSVLVRYALVSIHGATNRPRVRHLRHHRHLTGERAEYVRHSQRLAMMDRDFTAADYEMLLDLDNNSQCLRRFLEGASNETVSRLPTYTFKSSPSEPVSSSPTQASAPTSENVQNHIHHDMHDDEDEDEITAVKAANQYSTGGPTPSGSELADDTGKKCVICLEDFEDGMVIRMLPCFHRFMADCIDTWLIQQAKCPVCKRSIREDLAAMPAGLT